MLPIPSSSSSHLTFSLHDHPHDHLHPCRYYDHHQHVIKHRSSKPHIASWHAPQCRTLRDHSRWMKAFLSLICWYMHKFGGWRRCCSTHHSQSHLQNGLHTHSFLTDLACGLGADDSQDVPVQDLRPGCGSQALHNAHTWCTDSVLHFHGLHHQQGCSLLHCCPLLHQHLPSWRCVRP